MAFESQVNLDSLVQGNNNDPRRFNVRRSGAVVSLVGATVEVAIKKDDTVFIKQAEIVYPAGGVYQITFTRNDLTTPGVYFMQPTVKFENGDELSGDVDRFMVTGKLVGVPPTNGDQPTNVIVTIDGGEF